MKNTVNEALETKHADAMIRTDQTDVVREHFADASTKWGARYGAAPCRMSDLDLLLRRETVHRLLRPVVAGAHRTLRVVDVGCGSGDVLDGFPRDSVRVMGMDLVPEMVAAAARSHPADRFLVGSVEHPPFMPGSADIVTCLGVWEYLPDPGRAMAAIHTMVRPGGHMIISFPNRYSMFRKLSVAEVRAERVLLRARAWLRRRRRDPDTDPKYHHTSWSVRRVRSMLRGSGFANVELRLHTYGLWGLIGRHPISLGLAAWMSRQFDRPSWFSASLACTIVARARKPDDDSGGTEVNPGGQLGLGT